jgi:uncharacterized protein YciI
VYHVVLMTTSYVSLEEALARAPDLIDVHRARARELHARGMLLMAGAFLDQRPGETLSAMAVCTTREAAEEFIRGDPFVQNGKVREWTIRAWSDLLAAGPN